MDVKIGWIIAFLLITLFGNLVVYGVVENNVAKAEAQSQATMQGVIISNPIDVQGSANVFGKIQTALMWDYPTIFNGSWIWVQYALRCVSFPAALGLAFIIFRLLATILMSLPSFLRWFSSGM